MNVDLVSIIMPSYKSEPFITDAIESVIHQSYKNWELIIVDDKSPDNANKIIRSYEKKDDRVKLIALSDNVGPAAARNKAIDVANGRYIAFLDSDDMWKPQKLERQIAFINDNNAALVFSNYELINENGTYIGKVIESPVKVSYVDLLKSNHIGCLTAMYDTRKVGKLFMPLINKRQDYGLWLKILRKTNVAYGMREDLATYRMVAKSVSSDKLKLIRYHYELFTKFERLSRIKACYYIVCNILSKLLYR
ncbi:glycosyltransferase family 2 protein [Salinivibrio sp. KP-1]|uniref:glycosyltransferase family 2 protein n=1 Tax=Salinivibrio sp. KP-1 TaxID=1406902 RepID=UPI000AB1FA1A|nr:glycosyltransferase family 2 protein [Salinivibrio sp. KP-1]